MFEAFEESILKLIQGRALEMINGAAEQTLLYPIEFLNNIPNASSVTEAIRLYFRYEAAHDDAKWMFESSLLSTMSDNEIAIVYAHALSKALVLTQKTVKSISNEDISQAIDLITPVLVTIFKFNLSKNGMFLDEIHEQQIYAAQKALCTSAIFADYGNNLPTIFGLNLKKEFELIDDYLDEQILGQPDVLEKFNASYSITDTNTLIEIYNSIRESHPIIKNALPIWDAPEDSEIANVQPLTILNNCEKYFNEFFMNQAMESRFIRVFTQQFDQLFVNTFSMSLSEYQEILVKSKFEMTQEQRSRLCKSNTLLQIFYNQKLDDQIKIFVEEQFRRFVNIPRYQYMQDFTQDQSSIDNITFYQKQKLKHAMKNGRGLSASFTWPEDIVNELPGFKRLKIST